MTTPCQGATPSAEVDPWAEHLSPGCGGGKSPHGVAKVPDPIAARSAAVPACLAVSNGARADAAAVAATSSGESGNDRATRNAVYEIQLQLMVQINVSIRLATTSNNLHVVHRSTVSLWG